MNYCILLLSIDGTLFPWLQDLYSLLVKVHLYLVSLFIYTAFGIVLFAARFHHFEQILSEHYM